MKLSSETFGSGQELVMLHGWGMNSAVWRDFAQRLAQSYRVTLIDLPGHGLSPYSGEQGLESWAAACLEVAPERAVWMGWSLGSMVAMQAILDAPARASGALMVAGMPKFVKSEDWPYAMELRTLNQFIDLLGDDMSRALERFLAIQMLGSDLSAEILRGLKARLKKLPDPDPEALQAGLDLLKQTDLRPRLAEIRCPMGWIYGGRDTLAPSRASKILPQWQRNSVIHTIDKAAHTPFLSHPEEAQRLVLDSLEAMV